jgi:hypothetical protein
MNRKKAKLLLVIGFFVLGILAVIASVTENTIAKIAMCIGFTTWVTGYFVLSHKFPQERYFLNYTKLTLPLFYGSHDYSLYLHLSTCSSIRKETVHFRRTFCHDYRVLL